MADTASDIGRVESVSLTDEMQRSYLDYAMSVIVSRALPDVKDGLKPVQRRIIYAMHQQGMHHTSRYQKSAAVVGEVLKNYHPHGDAAVYDAMVRMAQHFSLRYPLVDGQGNFGCFTKDTKIRLADGRSLSFDELIKEHKQGKKHRTFSFNHQTGKVELGEITHPRLTRRNAQLIAVNLDNGAAIRCTPDHRFLLRNGRYIQAQYLKAGDSLMPAYFNTRQFRVKRGRLYCLSVLQPLTGHEKLVHQLANDRVIRSRILRYSSKLFAEHQSITPILYQAGRGSKGNIPKLETALSYFNNFGELASSAQNYNHKVLSVIYLKAREDVYDITVDPWHNFLLNAGVFVHNSIDGDPAAAQRYTEARLSTIADELLHDINKNTVDFIENYSGTTQEPVLLPTVIPNLLLNGASGIAVGMATQIPPHNLGEVTDALIYMIEHPSQTKNPAAQSPDGQATPEAADKTEAAVSNTAFSSEATVEDLIKFVKGPDFPTGASIYDQAEILNAYVTGKGRVVMRAKAEIEEAKGGRFDIIVTELPFQINKAVLIARIAELVKDKKIDGIADLRDESDQKGMRIVIELKRDAKPQSVLNNLYKATAMQSVFNVNMVALSEGVPHLMTLKRILEEFIHHRQVVIVRRSEFELAEARAREHILEGLKIAVDHIDAVIKTIRESEDADTARVNLMSQFKLTELQASAILDMQLRRLAALERQKIEDDLKMVQETVTYLEDLLAHPEKILRVAKEELKRVRERYGDSRRTRVYKQKVGEFSEEDLVADELTVVTVTQGGYIKRQPPGSFRTQARGGKGVSGITTKEEDTVSHIFYCKTLDNLLFFTDRGRVFQIKVWEIPESSRIAKGQAIVNLINIDQGEMITAILTNRAKDVVKYLVMGTVQGNIKKTPIEEYANIRKNGLISIKLDPGDLLRWVVPTTGENDVIIVSRRGQSIRISEKQVKPTHRDTSGVIGIKLSKEDEVVSLNLVKNPSDELLVVMENGLGKKTRVTSWKIQNRGGSGIKAADITPKTGQIVTAQIVDEAADTLVMTSSKGQLIKLRIKDVPTLQRQTQGVILMRVKEKETVAAATVVASVGKSESEAKSLQGLEK